MLKYKKILVPLISILLGLAVGGIILFLGGYSVIDAYRGLWEGMFGSAMAIGEIFRRATPLILSGLAFAFAFRSGLFNIGAEGQLLVGWLAAVWVGYAITGLPTIIHLPLAIAAGALAGAIWAFVPAVLKATRGVHEVVVTIMMNYIALHFVSYMVSNVMTDGDWKTPVVQETASLQSDFLKQLTDNSSMHWGILIAIAAAVIVWIVLERTTKGYEIRSVGYNKHASGYAGMSVNKNIIYAMLISGSLAGLAGAMEGLGGFGYMTSNSGFTNIGFDGIAVALLGAANPFGIVLAGFFFAALQVGGASYAFTSIAPTEIVSVVIATIIFFIAISYFVEYLLEKYSKKSPKKEEVNKTTNKDENKKEGAKLDGISG